MEIQKRCFVEKHQKPEKNKKTTPIVQNRRSVFHIDIISTRAAGRIRTADLILTKDALYLLSYSSKFYAP